MVAVFAPRAGRFYVRLFEALKRSKASCSGDQQLLPNDVVSSTSEQKHRSKVRQNAANPTDSQSDYDWMNDGIRESNHAPGNFRSRNTGYDRFFGTQRYIQRVGTQVNGKHIRKKVPGVQQEKENWAGTLNLPTIDYNKVQLPSFEKNCYREHPAVTRRSKEEVARWITKNQVTLRGKESPKPVFTFDEAGFPEKIVRQLHMSGFTNPTEIQSIGWPVALSGHDMISVARTGSGKTLAYMLPGIVHVQNQAKTNETGPSVLVLAPTRELVQQIGTMTAPFWHNVHSVYGGAGRVKQAYKLRKGVDILAAAPGRLLDFLTSDTVNLQRCTYLVLDEADRMLDMGFEPQIRKIISMIRPDRQTLMFSATWPKEIRSLAKDFLREPTFVNIGSLELAANPNIKQIVEVVYEEQKVQKLFSFLDQIANESRCKTLVFVGMKRTADWLMRNLRKQGYSALSLHGDKSQTERNFVMNDFKNGECTILIATDVAARGLDVNDIKYVVNYDCPKNGESYIHRIGRTARYDKKGTSYTLCTTDDSSFAGELIEIMKEAEQKPPPALYDIASGKRQARAFKKFVSIQKIG